MLVSQRSNKLVINEYEKFLEVLKRGGGREGGRGKEKESMCDCYSFTLSFLERQPRRVPLFDISRKLDNKNNIVNQLSHKQIETNNTSKERTAFKKLMNVLAHST
jgi:hypothetical protein